MNTLRTKMGAAAVVALAASALPVQAVTWVPYTDIYGPKEYAVVGTAVTGAAATFTWHQAEAYAQTLGAHLVAINDPAENNWIVSTFGDSELFWIGATDQAGEGNWEWTNGDPFGYANWNGGEPNDITEEEWGHINFSVPGGWNDWESGADYVNPAQGNISYQNDSYPIRAILERPVLVCVCPDADGTWLLFGAALSGLAFGRRALRRA